MLSRLTFFIAAWLPTAGPALAGPSRFELIDARKIWDAAPHNAFTDLVRWRDSWWCVFREADAHVGGDGRIRILTSPDGTAWQSAALVEEKGIDLRDPKISVMPDGRLMLTAGGSVYHGGTRLLGRQPRVAFSKDGREWSAPQRVLGENHWLWRVTWHEGMAYGVSYQTSAPEGTPADTGEWTITLHRSRDGTAWEPVAPMTVSGRPNETTLRFRPNGEAIALIRRETADREGWQGHAKPPYTQWQWHPIGRAIGGPELLVAGDGRLIACGRDYRPAPEGTKTVIGLLDNAGWHPELTLPSGGDTSYPGMVEHMGILWISYYSTHEGKSAIYLARVRPSAENR